MSRRVLGRRRPGVAMVAVLALLVLLVGLGATLLTNAGRSRRQVHFAATRLQRELALDAAIVHAFHDLKGVRVRSRQDLEALAGREGSGEVGSVAYSFRLVPDAGAGTVRVEARAGEEPALEGAAVAAVRHRVAARHVAQRSRALGGPRNPGRRRMRQRWSLEYLGGPAPGEG